MVLPETFYSIFKNRKSIPEFQMGKQLIPFSGGGFVHKQN